ncbi:MAG TPA: hypothetical protein PLC74_13690 [Acetobacteraceae bacterium]|nr:hypothetical protein [Acetobacteraceae bacterium]
MANITFNPALTLSPQNSILLETQGWYQGAVMDDPTSRLQLVSAIVASTVTQPMWGGMAVTESVASIASNNRQGNPITIAATNAAITAFTVFNQANNAITVPGNSVPIYTAGSNMAIFRLGSNIRIPVQADTGLITALEGGATNQQVSWDFTNQALTTYSSGAGALPVKVLAVNANSRIVSYNSTTGLVSWMVGNAVLIQI